MCTCSCPQSRYGYHGAGSRTPRLGQEDRVNDNYYMFSAIKLSPYCLIAQISDTAVQVGGFAHQSSHVPWSRQVEERIVVCLDAGNGDDSSFILLYRNAVVVVHQLVIAVGNPQDLALVLLIDIVPIVVIIRIKSVFVYRKTIQRN